MDYKTTGVDIDAGNNFVKLISKKVKSTHRPEVIGGFGGFNGMTRIPEGYEKPVLVSGADGVGTKVHVAELNIWGEDKSAMYGIGIDLVAMCVNDVITCGAKPLYFLDYICTSSVTQNEESLKQLVFGIGDGCHESECSLLGGETAEHPRRSSMVDPIRDLSGFCTGIVEENEIIDGSLIRSSDSIIGISSSGIHSNGFSLIREMLFKQKIMLKDTPELLEPTRIYSRLVHHLLDQVPIVGMAHITGGGLMENLSRVMPDHVTFDVNFNSWPLPKIFQKIMLAGEIPEEEMKRVFNMGIGYCLVVPRNVEQETIDLIRGFHDWDAWVIGQVK